MNFNGPFDAEHATEPDREPETVTPPVRKRRRGRLAGFGLVLVAAAALAFGAWSHYAQRRQTLATAEQRAGFRPAGPRWRRSSPATISRWSRCRPPPRPLPAPTSSPAPAAISTSATSISATTSSRASCSPQIIAPELDHQIAQAEATLAQLKASLQQAQANRNLAQVTWERDRPLVDKGWVTAQQGTIDEQTLKAQEAAVSVAQANIDAQQAQLQVLHQQKLYQRVVAPFDGVITQRNIDVGSLVQADATSGTFMFTMQQSNVIRTQVYVPQDAAFGVEPGVDAVVRVPEIPDRTFPGQGDAHCRCAAAGHADAADRGRHPEPGRRAHLGHLLHRRAPDPAQDVELHGPGRRRSSSMPAACRSPWSRTASCICARSSCCAISAPRSRWTDGVKRGDQVILNPSVDLADGARVKTGKPIVVS